MDDAIRALREALRDMNIKSRVEPVGLFPGISLIYLSIAADSFVLDHTAMPDIFQIHYCRSGQVLWSEEGGGYAFLNPGDFSFRVNETASRSVLTFPKGEYEGVSILIDRRHLAEGEMILLPESLTGSLREKFFGQRGMAFLAGNEQTEAIASYLFGQTEELCEVYRRIKTIELLLYLYKVEPTPLNRITEYRSEQIEIVRKVHGYMVEHIDRRLTIDELSREYHINPTTLKKVFKAIYGTSIAAHIKEHRMENAAALLSGTDMSLAEIAQTVGYDSQSKFTSAFKAQFGITPKEYRKRNRQEREVGNSPEGGLL